MLTGDDKLNILLINGPNLNLLGTREVDTYGNATLKEVVDMMKKAAQEKSISITDFQSNSESDIIDFMHKHKESTDYMILNPAAFTHTSIALRDAVLALDIPCIEVHISNIHKREDFRKISYFSDIAIGTISGFGIHSYLLALDYIIKKESL
ncbi:type II 3-dehydroquinate dehydratase [Spirochaetota bacterium]